MSDLTITGLTTVANQSSDICVRLYSYETENWYT